MPSYSDPSKKRLQLLQRQQELHHAIHSEHSTTRVIRAAERVRAAQLSLLKARLHSVSESRILSTGSPKPRTRNVGKIAEIEKAAKAWMQKPVEAIITEVAA